MAGFTLNKAMTSVSFGDAASRPAPSLGFLEALQAATWSYAYVTNQPFGFERLAMEADAARQQKARDAGFEPPPSIGGFTHAERYAYAAPYTEWQRAAFQRDGYVSSLDDEGRRNATLNRRADELSKNDAEWRAFSKAHPELEIPDNEEMRQAVIKQGKAMYEKWEGSTTTWGGSAGGIIGTVAGAMTDPIQSTTAMVGGFGRSALERIAAQFGLGSGAEVLSEQAGGLENMRWFGVEPDMATRIKQIAIAGAIPAGAQIIGEGLGAAAKALQARQAARTAPKPPPPVQPAPTPSPAVSPAQIAPLKTHQVTGVDAVLARWADQPYMPPRVAKDADAMDGHLQRFGATPQDAPVPVLDPMRSLATPTKRLMDSVAIFTRSGSMDENAAALKVLTDIADAEGVHAAAANLDPKVFKELERLTTALDAERLRKATDIALIHERLSGRTDTADRLVAEQAAILGNPKASAAAKQKAAARIEELAKVKKGEKTPDLSVKLDKELEAKIVKLAPAVERALARAQGVWDLTAPQRATLAKAAKDGSLQAEVRKLQKTPSAPVLTPYEAQFKHVPELQSPLAGPIKAGESVADVVDRVNQALAKNMDEESTAFLATTKSTLKGFDDKEPIQFAGAEGNKVYGGDDSGLLDSEGRAMTVKQAYEDLEADKEALIGLTTCQTR